MVYENGFMTRIWYAKRLGIELGLWKGWFGLGWVGCRLRGVCSEMLVSERDGTLKRNGGKWRLVGFGVITSGLECVEFICLGLR